MLDVLALLALGHLVDVAQVVLHSLSTFGRALPGSESFPSMHQCGRHVRRGVTTRYASWSCGAPPSLPTPCEKLAGTATTPIAARQAALSRFPNLGILSQGS